MSATPVDELNGPALDRAVEREVFEVHRPSGSPTIHAYSADLRYARDMERQIEKLGIVEGYVHFLFKLLFPTYLSVWDVAKAYEDLFRLIHATPTERCRAALKAVRQATESS